MKYWVQAIATLVCIGALIYGDSIESSLLIFAGGIGACATLLWILIDHEEDENKQNLGL